MTVEINKTEPSRVRICRLAYFILSWVLMICIVVQVFLAGVALFDHSEAWKWHRTFVHMFEYISIILFILGIIGKLSRELIWGSLGLFALFNIQYYTAHGIAGALHPVLALALFWGALALIRGSYPLLIKRR
ncbi:DUF6220 domain-containing protein [Paenibacillus favisporus]|uniref:DUF6220 domain-containing protein n=1 Tax=Paenibacillus favisporus TaxID=221028 RepID=UPI002DBCEAB2|nr:DUF6220 domain-containing protein [Paenibacillus favisporus]MEC0174324.1 DUF6220 domain-containing protein [Paenibacillus favisporus]